MPELAASELPSSIYLGMVDANGGTAESQEITTTKPLVENGLRVSRPSSKRQMPCHLGHSPKARSSLPEKCLGRHKNTPS